MGCSPKKTDQTTDSALRSPVVRRSLPDSVDHAIEVVDQRLDIKMKRKMYEIRPGTLVTIQKWFEFGDTTRLLKMREEILTGDTKMALILYHYIDGNLAKIHEYQYDKKCDNGTKQCMTEAKYFFANDTLYLAQRRENDGTSTNLPVIERASFEPFQPDKKVMATKVEKQNQINEKYAALPFPKPRPEQGTPVH